MSSELKMQQEMNRFSGENMERKSQYFAKVRKNCPVFFTPNKCIFIVSAWSHRYLPFANTLLRLRNLSESAFHGEIQLRLPRIAETQFREASRLQVRNMRKEVRHREEIEKPLRPKSNQRALNMIYRDRMTHTILQWWCCYLMLLFTFAMITLEQFEWQTATK